MCPNHVYKSLNASVSVSEAKRSERARVPNFRLCHMEQVSKPAVRRKKIESERKMKCKNTQKKKMNETGNLPCRLNKSEQIGGTRVKQKKLRLVRTL